LRKDTTDKCYKCNEGSFNVFTIRILVPIKGLPNSYKIIETTKCRCIKCKRDYYHGDSSTIEQMIKKARKESKRDDVEIKVIVKSCKEKCICTNDVFMIVQNEEKRIGMPTLIYRRLICTKCGMKYDASNFPKIKE
jgi:Na+/citrate or Na+/malate symporter